MTSTDKTLDWNGAPVIQTIRGLWLRQPDGTYQQPYINSAWTPADLAHLDPKAVELHPATTPEPRTVTWRKGEDRTAIREAWKPGRRAQVVTEMGTHTATRDGAITDGCLGIYTLDGWLDYGDTSTVTVWLPETPEVPKWAQGCDGLRSDDRLVTTEDGRVWLIDHALDGSVTRWRERSGRGEVVTTDELADMDARLIVDRDGKAVL